MTAEIIHMPKRTKTRQEPNAICLSAEAALAQRDFLAAFEAVFGDADWEITKVNIQAPHLIRPGATFLEPGVTDEGANWANRAVLLSAYRRLIGALQDVMLVHIERMPKDEI